MKKRNLLRAGALLSFAVPLFASCTAFDDVEVPHGNSSGSSSTGPVFLPDPGTQLTTTEIKQYITTLGGDKAPSDKLTDIADAVQKSCVALAPPELSPRQCAMLLVSMMSYSSGFDPSASNTTSGDPVPSQGLLQDRWNSTMREAYVYGPIDRLTTVGTTGCDVSDSMVYSVFGLRSVPLGTGDVAVWNSVYAEAPFPPEITKIFSDVHCNVALGAWDIFTHAVGHEGAAVCDDAKAICSAIQDQQGTIAVGLVTHQNPGGSCAIKSPPVVTAVQAGIDKLRQQFGASALDLEKTPVSITQKDRGRYCAGEALPDKPVCTNVPTEPKYQCRDQAFWGKCGANFLKNLCDLSCDRCGDICSDITPPFPDGTSDNDQPKFYCDQLKLKGQCNTMLPKYCKTTCGRC